MLEKPDACRGCSLYTSGRGFSRPDGTGRNRVLVVGESLGTEEFYKGRPFQPHAPAGSGLVAALRMVGVEREDFRLWNLVACQPPGNKLEGTSYGPGAIEHCKRYYAGVAKDYNVVLALGNLVLKTLTGVSGLAKQKQSISNLRGYPLVTRDNTTVVGSYHPSFIRRGNSSLFPCLMDDVQKALDIAAGTYTTYEGGADYVKPKYLEFPSLDGANVFMHTVLDNASLPLGIDIETQTSSTSDEDERDDIEEHDIILIQFSLGKGTGIAFPWTREYLPYIRKILKCSNIKLGYNWWNFDAPRVKAAGVQVEGLPYDLMWMFKHYSPSLRRNLQAVASYARFPFPWKHLYGDSLEYYGCADVDALHYIYEWLPEAMKQLGVWEGYLDHLYGYYPILQRASDLGIPVDDKARIELNDQFVKERAEVMQSLEVLMPLEVRAVGPRRKNKETGEVSFGYVRVPKPLKKLVVEYRIRKARLEAQGKAVITFRQYARLKGFIVKDHRWCKLQPLKMSKEQIVRYIQWKRTQLLAESTQSLDIDVNSVEHT